MTRFAFIAMFCVLGVVTAAEPSMEFRAADGSVKRPLQTGGESKFSVLIFFLHDCPICNAYAPEIERLRAEYEPKGCTFYLVQTDPSLTAETALKHAKDYGLKCAVLLDDTNRLAQKCGAMVTPQVAIIGAGERVLYLGRIDDLYADYGKRRPEATVHDLRMAMNAVLAGKSAPTAGGPAIGCFIPLKKSDESRK